MYIIQKKQAVTTIYNKYTIFLLKCGCVSSITKIVTQWFHIKVISHTHKKSDFTYLKDLQKDKIHYFSSSLKDQ